MGIIPFCIYRKLSDRWPTFGMPRETYYVLLHYVTTHCVSSHPHSDRIASLCFGILDMYLCYVHRIWFDCILLYHICYTVLHFTLSRAKCWFWLIISLHQLLMSMCPVLWRQLDVQITFTSLITSQWWSRSRATFCDDNITPGVGVIKAPFVNFTVRKIFDLAKSACQNL